MYSYQQISLSRIGVNESQHGIIELYDDIVSRLVRIDFVSNAYLCM